MYEKRLAFPLFLLRISIFLVFLIWTLDKFLNPGHATVVFQKFYMISNIGPTLLNIVGTVQLLIIIAFLVGFQKKYSYGLVLILHTISTLSSWKMYFIPFSKSPAILFYASIPMLAGCYILFVFRNYDTILTIKTNI